MRIITVTDLRRRLEEYRINTNITLYPRSYFNLSDFIDITFSDETEIRQTNKLSMSEADCPTNKRFDIIQDLGDPTFQAKYKCFLFQPNNSFLNFTKNETFSPKQNGEPSKIQFDSLFQFGLEIRMKSILVDFLKATNQFFYLDIMVSNFKPNPVTFELEEYFNVFYISIDLDSQVEAQLIFRKQSVLKKYEFDIFEIEFSDVQKYKVDQDSFKLLKNSRYMAKNLGKDGKVTNYVDTIYFKYGIFEETNEVTFLTLDDIMAVLGGFMGIVFAVADVVAKFFNEENGESLIMRFLEKKYDKYETNISNARNNINMQMEYFDTYLKKKHEGQQQKDNNNKNKVCFDDRFDKNDDNNKVSNIEADIYYKERFKSESEKLHNNPNNINYMNIIEKNKNLNEDAFQANHEYKNMDLFSNQSSRQLYYNSLKNNNNRIKDSIDEDINQEYTRDDKKIPLKTTLNKNRLINFPSQEQEEIQNKAHNENRKVLMDSNKFDLKNVKENETLVNNKLLKENKNKINRTNPNDLNENNINNKLDLNGSFIGDSAVVDKKQMSYTLPREVDDLKIPVSKDSGK